MLVGLRPIEEIIVTCIWSGYVAKVKSLSLLIVARVESGKTEMLMQWEGTSGLYYANDLTAWACTNPRGPILSGLINREIKHIVVPDLLTPLGRNPDTVETLATFLNSLIEEGVISLQTYATKLRLDTPIHCGLIGAIAAEELERKRKLFLRIGLMSRLLPISYSYTPATVVKIRQSIARQEQPVYYRVKLSLPDTSVPVELSQDLANQLIMLTSETMARWKDKDKYYGFRLQKQLQTFAMARALSQGRDMVTPEDADFAADMTKYINFQHGAL